MQTFLQKHELLLAATSCFPGRNKFQKLEAFAMLVDALIATAMLNGTGVMHRNALIQPMHLAWHVLVSIHI